MRAALGGGLLGAALFVQTPALFNRLGHPALCAHWVLLAALGLVVDGRRGDRAWHRGAWLALSALVAAVQPYLAGMVLLLAFAAVANRAWRAATWPRAAAGIAAECAAAGRVMGGIFWACGYFLISSASLQSEGVGLLSMNLLGPITGMGFTTFLPEIPLAVPGQQEGHVYFGMGWLLLAAVAAALRARAGEPAARLGAGWLAVAACAAIAISPVVTFGAATLVDLREWAPASLATFRSSGRFGWVTMYAVFTFVALTLVRRLPHRAAMAAFAVAVVVQGVDMSAAYRGLHARERSAAWTDYDSRGTSAA